MSAVAKRAKRQRLADVQRYEATLGLTGWLTGNQFSVGWNGRALDTPELLKAAQAVLPSVAKIATLEPSVGAALGLLGQLLSDSTMAATAEQMTAAVSPFRDLVDLIAVRREGMHVSSVGVVFADNIEPPAILRLDRPDAMLIERVGPGWELSRQGPGDDGYWVSPRLSLARAQSAIAAYRSGDLSLSTIDWRFEPDS